MQNYLTCILLFMPLLGYSQKVAVVDVQKVFDGYSKMIEAKNAWRNPVQLQRRS